MEEEAQAIQETAKAAGKAIEAAEKLGAFLSTVFGEPIKTAVGMLQDKLAVARWERQLRLADRVMQILRERGASATTPVKPKLAIPILENASLETDDYLQDLWANLLASAMTEQTSQKVRSAFVDIIQQLEPIDVKILEYLYSHLRSKLIERGANVPLHYWKEKGLAWNIPIRKLDIMKTLNLDEETYHTAVDNLIRVRLADSFIGEESIDTEDGGSADVSLHYGYKIITITPLGLSFIEVCAPSGEREDEDELIARLKATRKESAKAQRSALETAIKEIEERFGKIVNLKTPK